MAVKQWPYEVKVYVKDSETMRPVAQANVNLYWARTGDLIASNVTDANGRATFIITWGDPYIYEVKALGYETTRIEKALYGETELVIVITKSEVPPPPELVMVEFYAVSAAKYRVLRAEVKTEYGTTLTNEDGYTSHLLTKGARAVTVSDKDARIKVRGLWIRLPFSTFTTTIEITEPSIFTIWVESGVIVKGPPPQPPFDLTDWLMANWPWLIVGAIGLVAITYIASALRPPIVVKVER